MKQVSLTLLETPTLLLWAVLTWVPLGQTLEQSVRWGWASVMLALELERPMLALGSGRPMLAWELAQAMLAQAKLMAGCCVNESAVLQPWLVAGTPTLATTLTAAGCCAVPAMVCLTLSRPQLATSALLDLQMVSL